MRFWGSYQTSLPTPRRLLWVTNMAAPYRLPVWRELARTYDLTVGLLESNRSLTSDVTANRGRDWLIGAEEGFRFQEIPGWKYARGDSRYYIVRSLRTLLHVRQFDIVVFGGWESPAYWQMLLAASLFGARRVGFYESTIATRTHHTGPIARARSLFFKSMHAVVVPGPAARESILEVGIPSERIVQGFNAIDVRSFHEAAASRDGEFEIIPGEQGHRFVLVGRFIELKRFGMVVKSFAAIAGPQDKLSIVGKGELEAELRLQAETSGCNIEFLPYMKNDRMPALLAQNHTLVLASSKEVWGLVVNEALATGLHVVVTENCGVVPSVEGMQGVFVATGDGSDLAEKMAESRDAWKGAIRNPAILVHTPEAFARAFEEGFELAVHGREDSGARS